MAPHLAAAREQRQITLEPMLAAFQQARQSTQALVVEGVGGFCVPLSKTFDTADMAQELALPVVLVVGMRLGCINHALLTAEAISSRNLQLAGWVANTVDPYMAGLQDNIGALRERLDAPFLGAIPRLDIPGARQAAAHLEFKRLAGWPAP
jgi:dethiobiotin synthetase